MPTRDKIEEFGTLPNGDPVQAARLEGGNLAVEILSFGATIRSLQFAGRPMVLSLGGLAEYVEGRAYFGSIAGRFANRIADGRFTLDNVEYQLSCNEAGRTHLHGGERGFSHRNWRFTAVRPASATLAYDADDGEEGYPGALAVSCTYEILGDGALGIMLEARCDRPTIINLAAHSYFNLDGAGSIVDHSLMIPADRYLPVDADKIPTGEQAPVPGTPFDFRQPRRIGEFPYDHAFVLGQSSTAAPRLVARLASEKSGIQLDILSTEPAVQFYDGHMLARGGYGSRAGLCLEPQRFPDAPNKPAFPSAVLRPGETYRQITEYQFRRIGD